MISLAHYTSPVGGITLASSDTALIGLWFDGQTHFGSTLTQEAIQALAALPSWEDPCACSGVLHAQTGKVRFVIQPDAIPILDETIHWLDIYFSGKNPSFTPALEPQTTPFRRTVYQQLLTIPYGHTITYGELAKRLALQTGADRMSAQAIGGAISHNPISLIIPCHRVVGARGQLTGYAGGIDKKSYLLALEHSKFEHGES